MAFKMKKTPREVVDHFNAIHQQIYQDFEIDFDKFGRTSTEKLMGSEVAAKGLSLSVIVRSKV